MVDLPSAAFLIQVRDATHYSYEAGEYPDDLPEDVARYLEPDGGLLATLDLAVQLLTERERLADQQLPQYSEILARNAATGS